MGLPKSLAPLLGSKPQKEDKGDIDEDGGHLYDRINMLYKEDYEPEPVLTQRMDDGISIISNLSPSCLKHELSYPNSPISLLMESPPAFFSFQSMKDLLLQNEKLMQAQEEKVQILAAINTSLPTITKKATLLQVVGVPNHDASVIIEAATGGKPLGSQDLHKGSSTSASLNKPRLPAPLGSAIWLPHSQWYRLSIWSCSGKQLQEWFWKGT